MANIIWGFGGVYISYSGQIVDLPFANGTLKFTPESNVRIAKSGRQIVQFRGWRPEIAVDLINISETEAREIQKLITMFNSARGNSIEVYPRYDATAIANVHYPCHCSNEFALQDIADSPVGQNLQLVFRGEFRVTVMPSNMTNTNEFTIAETISGVTYTIAETIGGVSYGIAEEF